jgi:hypothetical protein
VAKILRIAKFIYLLKKTMETEVSGCVQCIEIDNEIEKKFILF